MNSSETPNIKVGRGELYIAPTVGRLNDDWVSLGYTTEGMDVSYEDDRPDLWATLKGGKTVTMDFKIPPIYESNLQPGQAIDMYPYSSPMFHEVWHDRVKWRSQHLNKETEPTRLNAMINHWKNGNGVQPSVQVDMSVYTRGLKSAVYVAPVGTPHAELNKDGYAPAPWVFAGEKAELEYKREGHDSKTRITAKVRNFERDSVDTYDVTKLWFTVLEEQPKKEDNDMSVTNAMTDLANRLSRGEVTPDNLTDAALMLITRAEEMTRAAEFEPQDEDTVITWNHAFPGSETEYTYVAFRAADGTWRTTDRQKTIATWAELTRKFRELREGKFWVAGRWDYQG